MSSWLLNSQRLVFGQWIKSKHYDESTNQVKSSQDMQGQLKGDDG